MTTELEDRVRRALTTIVDAVPIAIPGSPALEPAPASPARSWRGALFTAAAAFVVVVAVAMFGPGMLPDRDDSAAPSTDGATLPVEFAGMSPLTADARKAPPGRVLAAYHQGAIAIRSPVTDQVVLLGADGRTYRRLALADDRGAMGADGEWSTAGFLLSPDGLAVAVAADLAQADRIEVQDLRTGRVRSYPVTGPGPVELLDWSPDGRLLLFAARGWDAVALLDTATGEVRRFDHLRPGPQREQAAFAPDGTRIAVVAADERHVTPGAWAIHLVNLTGAVLHVSPLGPDHTTLCGAGWSPDGRLIVVSDNTASRLRLRFLDPTGSGAPVPAPVEVTGTGDFASVLGWRNADTLLVTVEHDGIDLMVVPIDGRPTSRISHLGDGPLGLARPGTLQLAEGLQPDMLVRDTGDPDRGPWPIQLRLAIVLVVTLIAGLVLLRRRARRRRASGPRVHPRADPRSRTAHILSR